MNGPKVELPQWWVRDDWQLQSLKDREYLEAYNALPPAARALLPAPELPVYSTGKPGALSVEKLAWAFSDDGKAARDPEGAGALAVEGLAKAFSDDGKAARDLEGAGAENVTRLVPEDRAHADLGAGVAWAFAPAGGVSGDRRALLRCAAVFLDLVGAEAFSAQNFGDVAQRLGIGNRRLQKVRQEFRQAVKGRGLFAVARKKQKI